MTKSLGALLGLLAVLGAVTICHFTNSYWQSRILKIGLVGGLIAFAVFLTQIDRFTPSVENPWQRPAGTATVRLCVWEGTWNLIKDRPILGAGLSGFKELYSQKYFTCDAEPLEYPHNFFLNFWTETGILGLAAIIWLLLRVFKLRITNYGLRVMPFQLVFLYWMIHGLVDVPYFKNDLALLWFVFLALLVINQEGVGVTSSEDDSDS